jgi:hypothetical protein
VSTLHLVIGDNGNPVIVAVFVDDRLWREVEAARIKDPAE